MQKMKYSNKKLLAAIAVIAATLCISLVYSGKTRAQASQDRKVVVNLSDVLKADSFEAQYNGDKMVGMTGIKKDGTRFDLKAMSKPTCATSCPAGEHLYCWESETEQMSICVCHGRHDHYWVAAA
jgi:hypothetical protein